MRAVNEFRLPDVSTEGGERDPMESHPAGAPPLDTWIIPTAPFRGAHYATFPPELCRIPIESMCPRHVCIVCGEPRRRITGEPVYIHDDGTDRTAGLDWEWGDHDVGKQADRNVKTGNITRHAETLGWTDCEHGDQWRPGVVFDPFAGSGTTLAVATGHGRDAIGIDIDARNAEHAERRVGMFLTVETPTPAPAE